MKLEETSRLSQSFGFQPAAVSRRTNVNGVEELELSFLELLGSIQNPEAANASSALSPQETLINPLSELIKQQSLQVVRPSQVAKASVSVSQTETSSTVSDEADADSKDLEWFRVALKPEELKLLPTLFPQGLPASVSFPFQLFSMPKGDASGFSSSPMAVSKGLAELVEKAYKTGRPVRVDLDQNASIILKIRQGKVSAEFLSSDAAMVLYLKQHLADLRNRMEAKQLPVGMLSSRQDDQDSPHRQQPDKEQS